MKARKVKGLHPKRPLADNAERIVRVRLRELCSFVPAVLDPGEVRALHDMRIAAKRLRYILEVTAEPCFGPYAATATKRAKNLQDMLGEIHDCDVQIPRLLDLIAELREADAAEARALAGDVEELDAGLAAGTTHAASWRGLESLAVHLRARRDLLYDGFVALWGRLQDEGFRARLEEAVGERPPVATPRSQDGNGTAVPAPLPSEGA
jgi:hypothetical protein